MVYGKDEASFISLAILIIFTANYYHSFSKLVSFVIKLTIFNLVSYVGYSNKQYLMRPLVELLEGKNVELNQSNYKLIRLVVSLLLILVFELGKSILLLIFILTILIFMIYAYLNFDVTYNPVIHSLWVIYYCFVVHQTVSSLILSYSIIGGLAMYIRLRFKQVNQQLQSKKIREIRKGIVQHERLSLCL